LLNLDSVPQAAYDAFRRDRTASFIVGVYTGSIFPFVAIVARDQLHASPFLISIMAAAPFVGNLFSVLWARAMEGRPKMPFAVWPWIVGRGVFMLLLFVRAPLPFALTVAFSQMLVTISSPAYAWIMKTVYPDDTRGRLMSYCRAAMMFVMVIATLVAGWLLKRPGNYRYVFPVGGLFGVVSAVIFSRIRVHDPNQAYDPPGTSQFLKGTFAILAQDRGFRWFAFSIFTYGFANLVLSPIYPIYQVDRLHITTVQAGVLMNIASVVWMLSYLYWGHYVDRRSPLSGAAICVFITGLIPITYFFSSNVWMLVPAFIVSGVVNAGIELSYFNSILHFAPDERVSHYQALFQWLLGIRGSVAPFVGSTLMKLFKDANWDYRYIFLLALLGMWAGGAMQVFGVRGKYEALTVPIPASPQSHSRSGR